MKNRIFIILFITLNNSIYSANYKNFNYQEVNDSQKLVEKIFLHTDRDYYSAGDDIWFKAYLIDASDRLLSNHSNNLHVELISPDLKIIDSRIIRLSEGLGNGDFQLSENLKSGPYGLRAYTNYMRNYDDQSFFFKRIAIINSTDINDRIFDMTSSINNQIEISFFPEGGSLVNNVTSNIAFKAVNALGAGCDVSGEIYSSAGNLVTAFRSTHLGMGTFSIRPTPGLSYYAIIRNQDGDEIRSEIPKSFSTGITLSVFLTEDNIHLTRIRTNNETLPLILNNKLLFSISARKTVLKTFSVKVKSLVTSFVLPVDDLPDGIATLTLYNQDSIPLCERLIFVQNSEDVIMTLETNKTTYKSRDSVSVNLRLSEGTGIQQQAFLSFSASEKIYSNSTIQFPSTISSYFLLESDVHGPVEKPSYYFDASNPGRFKDLDLLLCTQGWHDFEWKYEKPTYLPENGFTISGKVLKLYSNAPLENSKVAIGIFQDEFSVVSSVPTDSSGRFSLENVEFTGNAYLVASSIGKREKFQGRTILDSLKYPPAKVQATVAVKNLFMGEDIFSKEDLTELLKEYEIIQSTRKKYTLSDTILLDEVKIVEERQKDPQTIRVENSRIIYGFPDKEIVITPVLENYSNIIGILIGRVPGLYFTAPTSNDSGIRMHGMGLFEPVFMLDGIIVPYTMIEEIPVSWIDRIDILKSGKAAALGLRGGNGVISVIRKTSNRITSSPVLYSASMKISGYNEPRVFYSPKHNSTLESDYKPDLRTTLFWEPNIKLVYNQDFYLNYFNADNPSVIKIVVEGITATGIPVTGTTEYEVQKL